MGGASVRGRLVSARFASQLPKVRQRAQVPELARVDDRPHGRDEAAVHVEDDDVAMSPSEAPVMSGLPGGRSRTSNAAP
jgi:hypothetical protein